MTWSVAAGSKVVVTPTGPSTADVTAASGTQVTDLAGPVTATSQDGGKTSACAVTFTNVAVPVTGVVVDHPTLSLTMGESAQPLVATVSPSNATDVNVTWTSDTPSVATGDTLGNVTPDGGWDGDRQGDVEFGWNQVCGLRRDGDRYPSDRRRAGPSHAVDHAKRRRDTDGDGQPRRRQRLGCHVDQRQFDRDSDLAHPFGRQLFCHRECQFRRGRHCFPRDGDLASGPGKNAVSTVTVGTAVAGIAMSQATAGLFAGESTMLTATVSPGNASDTSVSWTSSDTNVATVTPIGVTSGVATATVTAIAAGSAIVTVTTTSGGKSATTSVLVSAAVAPPALGGASIAAAPGGYAGATLAVDSATTPSTPYIAFRDSLGNGIVQRFSAGAWVQVGSNFDTQRHS